MIHFLKSPGIWLGLFITGAVLADQPVEITNQGVPSQNHSHSSGLYPPEQAIDGNLDTFNHTESSTPGAAWELLFPDEREIGSVEIVSRDCCAGRLNGATLRMLDGEGEEVFEIDIVDSGPLTTFTAEIPEGTLARRLRIGFDPGQSGIVHLAEVRVFGTAGDPPLIDQFTAAGTTLNWQITGADTIELFGVGPVAASGSLNVTPTESTAYFLTATNECASITASAAVIVDGVPLQPVIKEFSATGDDWIEIWNPGNSPFSLDGWHLTDDPVELERWAFPAGETIKAGGLLVLPRPFGLAREDGSFLALVDPIRVITSQFTYPEQFEGSSYGLDLEGNETYFLEPSPGEFNLGPGVSGFLQGVNFSTERGIFNAPFSLTLMPKTPGATVLYSLDSSDPSLEYSGTIAINSTTVVRAIEVLDGFAPPRSEAHTYLFPNAIAQQPEDPVGFPDDWLPSNASGALAPIPRRTDYEMDAEIVSAAPFTNRQGNNFTIPASLSSLPSLCLTLPSEEMWDPDDGLHANALKRGRTWEREISMEVIDPASGEHFHTGCGLRIHGGRGRVAEMLKKSFRLYFRGDYGATKLKYPLFDGMPEGGVDHLVLRGGNGKTWASPWRDLTGSGNSLPRVTYLRDQFLRDSNRAMDQPTFAGTFAHLYINGLYWGLYNPVERPGGPYAANHFGGDADTDWDFLKWANGLPTQVTHGDTEAWDEVLALSRSNPAANFDEIAERVDIENLADFLISNFYVGNIDWAGTRNNSYAFRSRTDVSDGKFRFMCWDGEESLLNTGTNSTDQNRETTAMELHLDLRTVPEYRRRFADRVHRHLVDEDGVLQTEIATARHDALADLTDQSIAAESARWGDLLRPNDPYSYDGDWTTEINNLTNNYLTTRPATTLSQLRADNLYPDTVAPVAAINGNSSFTLAAPAGEIWFTTDGSDPINSPTAEIYDASANSRNLIALDGTWEYLDDGSDLSTTSWTSRDFDSLSWSSGVAPLGYGGITNVTINTEINFGNDSNNKHITTYFRRDFQIEDVADLGSLLLHYMRDDGAVVYLNGTEIGRSNLPEGAINASTRAIESIGGSSESELIDLEVPSGLLVTGKNTIAVEVHQNRGNSSDFVFALGITEITDGIALSSDTRVKTRVLYNGQWSALEDETFRLGNATQKLVVSEIMYHPASSSPSEIAAGFNDDDDFEFIEIRNFGSENLLLDGMRFTKGVDINLEGTLSPGEAGLLVANRAAFESRHGLGLNILGQWQTGDRLDNGGEQIRLRDADNTIIQEFTYNDRSPWPTTPDGGGPSLILIAPDRLPDHSNATNWRQSSNNGGNPGSSDASSFSGGGSAELLAYASGGPLRSIGEQTFELEINPLADDVIIGVETSTDLETWSDLIQPSALGPISEGFATATFITNRPSASPRFFVRYRVSLR